LVSYTSLRQFEKQFRHVRVQAIVGCGSWFITTGSDAFRALHPSSGFNPVNKDQTNKYSPSEAHTAGCRLLGEVTGHVASDLTLGSDAVHHKAALGVVHQPARKIVQTKNSKHNGTVEVED
jgi:hypothetical protein